MRYIFKTKLGAIELTFSDETMSSLRSYVPESLKNPEGGFIREVFRFPDLISFSNARKFFGL